MQDYNKAIEVLKIVTEQVINSKFFTGIEIGVLKKDGIYTDNVCVRVLVNSKGIKHKELKIPKRINDIVIEVEYKIIKPLS